MNELTLVDTSVWVQFLRYGDADLEQMLCEGSICCHPFIIGEIACGMLKNRDEILTLLNALPQTVGATHDEIMAFIEHTQIMGKGLGYVDMHLLASARLSGANLWTMDKNLIKVATGLGITVTS